MPQPGGTDPATPVDLDPTRFLRALVETSEDAIVAKDTRGIVLAWNASAERIFGYSAAEAIGRHITLIIPENRRAEEDVIMARLVAGEQVRRFETVRRTRDGRLIDVELTIAPVRDDHGEVVGASKIARDVTDRRRLERELADTNHRKDAFLATLAHELRNPLGAIRTSVAVMRSRHDPAAADRALSVVERQCAQVTRLLDDLLDVSRITHDRLELQLTDVDLTQVVRDTVDGMAASLAAAGVAFEAEMPAEPLPARVDPARLQQMIGNLLANAAKYTPPGGRARLTLSSDDEAIAITVSDTGIGLAPEMQSAIFDLFVQVPDRHRSRQGLGIGLALVRRLAELHGGTARAQSDGPGHGSTFEVRLPRAPVATGAAAPDPDSMPAGEARHVLIVDDDLDNADAFAAYLRVKGHLAAIARSGEEALEAEAAVQPDVVLLDIGLPGIDGYETCRRLRARGTTAAVAALTGWGQGEDRRRAAEAGFDEHFVKPVNPEKVLAFVEAAPRRARQTAGPGTGIDLAP